MSNVFHKLGYQTISSDIRDTGYQDYIHDFTAEHMPLKFDWIITNPPFSLAEQFILKAYSCWQPFAMLLKSQYWHAASRVKLFEGTEPTFVLPLTWRPDFTMGGKGSPLMDVLWTVWIPGRVGCKYLPLTRKEQAND
jgi:hypothetical protein